MKLHLPLSLRLSLALSVAAIAAAPSHAAVTTIDITGWNGYQNGAVTVGRTVAEDGTASVNSQYVTLNPAQKWNSEWSVVFSVKGSTLQDEGDRDKLTLLGLDMRRSGQASGIIDGATISGNELILTTWESAKSGSATLTTTETGSDSNAINFSEYDNVTFVMSRHDDGKISLTGYNSNDFNHELFSLRGTLDQSFSNYNLTGFVFGGLGTHTKLNNASNHATFASDSDAKLGSYDITRVGFSAGSVANVSDLVTYYYGAAPHDSLTWNGDPSGGNWSDASWNDGTTGSASFGTLDSVTFATEGATVTVDISASAGALSVEADTNIVLGENLSASSLTVADGKTLTLSGNGTAETGTLSGGAVNVSGSTITVEHEITDTTLTVSNGGTVTANSLVGVTATVEAATDTTQSSTLALAGTGLGAVGSNTVVNGTLTLTGSGRVTVAGNVTLGSVVNNLTAGDSYTFVGVGRTLGDVTLKFTKGVTDLTGNTHSRIGFDDNGTIIVGAEASVKTSLVYNSSTVSRNAAVIVEKGGTLEMSASGTNHMLSLNNQGTVTAAGHLKIENGSHLGGKVNVGGTLTINSGTTEISGNVSAKGVGGGAVSTFLRGSADGKGKLTITGDSSTVDTTSSLSGDFTIVKEGGTNAQCFRGNNSAFTGSLAVKSGTLNLAGFGDNALNLKDVSVSDGTVMGLYARTLSEADEAYKANVSVASLQASGGTLNANVVMGDASRLILDGTLTMGGSLTLNQTLLSGALLDSLSEKGDKVTLFDGLAWSSLTIGSGVSTLAATDEVGQWTTDTDGSSYYQFSSADLEAAFGNLNSDAYEMRFYGTADGASGSLAMVYIPEPTSATLSLLALAGLCARRRRR